MNDVNETLGIVTKQEHATSVSEKIGNQKVALSAWADGLTLATLITGGIALTAAPVNATIATEICCGFGAMAVCRSVREKKWLLAVGAVFMMAVMAICTIEACQQREHTVRSMQQAFGG